MGARLDMGIEYLCRYVEGICYDRCFNRGEVG
jgi:hypothetical protein